MPLSSGLSGSYSTAAMLAQEEKYKEKVYVVDHGRISTPLHQSILDALEMITPIYPPTPASEVFGVSLLFGCPINNSSS